MNDNEINAVAQGVFLYLREQCKDPIDALSVILCTVLIYYEQAKNPEANYTIEEFAGRFSKDIVAHWKSRTTIAQGTETMQ